MKKLTVLTAVLLVAGFAAANGHGNLPSAPEPPESPPTVENGTEDAPTIENDTDDADAGEAPLRPNIEVMNDSAEEMPQAQRGQDQRDRARQARAGQQRRGPPEGMKGPKNVTAHLAEIEQRLAEKNVTPPGLERAQAATGRANKVRGSVKALVAAGNMTGIGEEVSSITREINSTAEEAVEAEAEIERRPGFTRALFGGNHRAAQRLEENANQTLRRVEELQNRLDDCENCSAEVKQFMQDRVETLRNQSTMWRERAREERGRSGIFGWLWN